MFSLSGKNALVTGATGGIGGAIAKALHDAGAKLVITGTRKEVLVAKAQELGEGVSAIAGDLSKKESIEQMLKEVETTLGGIDIVVCNAGITRDNLSLRMKDEEWQEVMDINLTATFRLNRAVMKGMLKKRYGRIINITSVVGVMGNPGQANYCASKAGIIGMSKSMAQEVASRNVTINCIAPGFIATPMTEALNEDQRTRITTNIPANRFGLPEDVAAGAVFLASEEASYITGQTLHINGGLLMV